MDYRAAVFEALDEQFGGDVASDYDSRDKIWEYAFDTIQERDDICQMCGAGPHIPFINEWVDQFCARDLT